MASPYDPPKSSVPTSAVFIVGSQIHISAPASHVFKYQATPSRFHEWCTFTPQAEFSNDTTEAKKNVSESNPDFELRKGSSLVLHARMDPAKPDNLYVTNLVVTEVSTPDTNEQSSSESDIWRISWDTSGWLAMIMSTKRVSEVIPKQNEDGTMGCTFRTFEAFCGTTAYAVKLKEGARLKERFNDWCVDLKKYAEATWEKEPKQA